MRLRLTNDQIRQIAMNTSNPKSFLLCVAVFLCVAMFLPLTLAHAQKPIGGPAPPADNIFATFNDVACNVLSPRSSCGEEESSMGLERNAPN
jgi:hypothetical protein